MIEVFTRSRDLKLYDRMREFIPADIVCHRCTQFQEWHHADDYLLYILDNARGIAINIDEDCFITNWNMLESMAFWFDNDQLSFGGFLESHIDHRRHNWQYVMNPFFNIFSAGWNGRIKKEWAIDGEIEPFNWLFAYMGAIGDRMVFEPSNNVGLETQNEFLIHCWWSREYGNDDYHTKRIDSIYQMAVDKAKANGTYYNSQTPIVITH